MSKTNPRQHEDLVYRELMSLIETGATNGALSGCQALLEVASSHTDATNMASVRHWLADEASNLEPQVRLRHKDDAAATAYALGLIQGTLAWPVSDRLKSAAKALDMLRASITQKRNGKSPLTKLMSRFTNVIYSAPVDAGIIGSDSTSVLSDSAVTFFSSPEQAYEAAIAEINAVTGQPAVTVDVVALRNSFDERAIRDETAFPPYVEDLHAAVAAHVEAGGHVRRIVTLTNSAQLDVELERQQALRHKNKTTYYELRAFIMDAPPGLAPLVVGGKCGLLGLSDPAAVGVLNACIFRSTEGVAFCTRAFEFLWHDRQARWLTTWGRGVSPTEVADLRKEIQALTQRRKSIRTR